MEVEAEVLEVVITVALGRATEANTEVVAANAVSDVEEAMGVGVEEEMAFVGIVEDEVEVAVLAAVLLSRPHSDS